MRSRMPLFALLFVAGSLALPHFAYAALPFFGPIVPTAYNVCPAGWGMLMIVINNLIEFALSLAIVFIAPIMIAYAGFLFVTNAGNSGKITEAKKLLTNTIVGIVIALSAWMLVDALMVALTGQSVSTWTALIAGNNADVCLKQSGAVAGGANQSPQTGISATGALNAPPSGKTGTVCDPTYLRTMNPNLTTVQANIFACIAAPESGCNDAPTPPNYAWGKGSSAAGAFQVLLSTNHAAYENANCYVAAGLPPDGSTQLNCQQGFANGNPKTDPAGAAIANRCLQAANSGACSLSAASALLQQNGGSFSPWQADVNSSKQSQCINGGGP